MNRFQISQYVSILSCSSDVINCLGWKATTIFRVHLNVIILTNAVSFVSWPHTIYQTRSHFRTIIREASYASKRYAFTICPSLLHFTKHNILPSNEWLTEDVIHIWENTKVHYAYLKFHIQPCSANKISMIVILCLATIFRGRKNVPGLVGINVRLRIQKRKHISKTPNQWTIIYNMIINMKWEGEDGQAYGAIIHFNLISIT